MEVVNVGVSADVDVAAAFLAHFQVSKEHKNIGIEETARGKRLVDDLHEAAPCPPLPVSA